MEMKLTINQLKNYLGTELKFDYYDQTVEFIGLKGDHVFISGLKGFQSKPLYKINPICYRLSDLDKFIPELGFVPIDKFEELGLHYISYLTTQREELIKYHGIETYLGSINYKAFQQLFQWNFWPFGDQYFEQGLIIDKLNNKQNER